MKATLGKRFRILVCVAVACVITLVNGVVSSETSVNGIVRQVGTQQVLNLWGTNYEMGYAHGYLMADKIRDLIEHYMIGLLAGGDVTVYNDLVANGVNPAVFQWKQETLDEMNGMAAGMIASGKNLYVASLGRNIDARDIRAFNLQEEFYFGCSSFGVWGTATANGETISARNFDFYYDSQGDIVNYQTILAYEPTGKAKFISFGWPGMVGLFSGMNENGVSVLDNTGNIDNPYSGPYHPVLEVFRDILETTTPANYPTQPLSSVTSVHELPSEIIQVGIPYQGSGDPVYYIEESPDMDVIRYPWDTDPGYDHIIATNHFTKVIPPPPSGESVDRYNTIRNGLLNLYGTGDGKVDSTEAWSLLHGVGNIVAPTLTSMVIRPNRMEFDVSFAKMMNGTFTSATDIQPQTYTWASLFPDHMLPDLVVQSIVTNPPSPVVGQSVAVTISVKNQGGGNADSYYIDFYRNLTSAPVVGQVGDATCGKSGLTAGAADSCTFTTTYTAAGSYRMWAQVDTEQQVAELSETNNVFGPQIITVGAPVAVNDAYGTTVNTPLNQAAPGVLSNDTSPQGAALTALLVSGPVHGALTLHADGSFAYTPAANFTGSDSFTYRATDGTNSSNTATVTITVAPPSSSTVSGTISPAPSGEGTTLTLSQGSATVATVTAAANGTYTFPSVAAGTYTVTPNRPGFTFTPASATVTVSGASVTGIDFTATGLAIDVTTSADRGTTGTTISTPAFTTRSGNELLLAFIATDANGSTPNITVTAVAGGGLTWTLVRRANTQFGTSEIWRAFATKALTNATVAASLSQSVAASITVVSFAGVNASAPVGATGGGSGASGAPTASLTTQGANSWVFGVGNDWDRAVARTPGANQAIVHQYQLNNSSAGILGTFWVQRQNATIQSAGTVVTVNDTAPVNDRWNLSIVEIRQ